VAIGGKVEQIAFEAVTINNVTIYEVDVEPEKTPEFMKSGMTAAVRFRVAEAEDVLLLPTNAIVMQAGESLVLIDDGRPETPPEPRRIRTGLSSGGRVEILTGLEGDEAVVRRAFPVPTRKSTGSTPFMPTRKKR
jgi:macrolide-specific efflux system membrane fusion protein